jgi:hypothetical protein
MGTPASTSTTTPQRGVENVTAYNEWSESVAVPTVFTLTGDMRDSYLFVT